MTYLKCIVNIDVGRREKMIRFVYVNLTKDLKYKTRRSVPNAEPISICKTDIFWIAVKLRDSN